MGILRRRARGLRGRGLERAGIIIGRKRPAGAAIAWVGLANTWWVRSWRIDNRRAHYHHRILSRSPSPPPHHYRRGRRNRYTRGESGGRRDHRGERGTPPPPPPPSNLLEESASVTGEGVGNGRRPGRDMRASYQLPNALPLSSPSHPLTKIYRPTLKRSAGGQRYSSHGQ